MTRITGSISYHGDGQRGRNSQRARCDHHDELVTAYLETSASLYQNSLNASGAIDPSVGIQPGLDGWSECAPISTDGRDDVPDKRERHCQQHLTYYGSFQDRPPSYNAMLL